MVYHVLIRDIESRRPDQGVGKRPIVIPAALVLPFLNGLARDAPAREVFDGLLDRFAVRLRDFHETPVHVENEKVRRRTVHHMRFSSSRTRSACSQVPTVIRTPPGIS